MRPAAAEIEGVPGPAPEAADAATRLALVRACEARIVNAWPAPRTLLVGDWVVRFASGYSARANSATPLNPDADLDEDALAFIVRLYREAGLPPLVRLTPLARPGLRGRLEAAGWRVRDESLGLIGPQAGAVPSAPAPPPGESLVLEPRGSRAWIEGVSAWADAGKRDPEKLAAIVGNVAPDAAFATLHENGAPLAFGMSVAERGFAEIGSILVSPNARGRGVGGRLVGGLMAWAAARGHRAFLQVESRNAPALKLYRALGFTELYRYSALALEG